MDKIRTGLLLILITCVSCQREKPVLSCPGGNPIVFGARLEGSLVSVETKATPLTSLSSFYVTASTGTEGADVPVWYNREFSGGPAYEGDMFWPDEDQGYHFYASSQVMASTFEGVTVDVDGSEDVVCAYKGDPTYGASNTLQFKHIFGRLRNVIIQAADGCLISNSSISAVFTPVTGGRYDIYEGYGHSDRTGWYRLAEGSDISVVNGGLGSKAVNAWLVPGDYEITLSWSSNRSGDINNFTNVKTTMFVEAGKLTDWTITLGDGYVPPATFAGFQIAPGNLYYDGTEFQIADDWNHTSYNSVYGKEAGSYYFNFVELGQYFDYRGSYFSEGLASIERDGGNTVEYDGVEYQIGTSAEWQKILTTDSSVRAGSTVNGLTNKHWAYISVNGVVHTGEQTPVQGILLFPDDKVITGTILTAAGQFDQSNVSNMNEDVLDNYLSQGCVFLPCSGRRLEDSWFGGDRHACYAYATASNSDASRFVGLAAMSSLFNVTSSYDKLTGYCTVRLIHNIVPVYSFGGLEITSGPLAYEGGNYVMKDSWDYCSYSYSYGLTNGSTFFNFIQIGELFEKTGFSNSDGSIENALRPFDDWRLPTRADLLTLTTGASPGHAREGSVVNGTNGAKYSFIRLRNVSFAGSSTPYGLLLFPDGLTINGRTLSGINNTTITSNVTVDELNVFLEQGCVFFPYSGYYSSGFKNGGTYSYIMCPDEYSSSSHTIFRLAGSSTGFSTNSKSTSFVTVRLVRDID